MTRKPAGIDFEQECVDRFYWLNGPCCAGCDWWSRLNSVAGECRRSAPVSHNERVALIGMPVISLSAEAGHVITPRRHCCGMFRDQFDWGSLPPDYLALVGYQTKG